MATTYRLTTREFHSIPTSSTSYSIRVQIPVVSHVPFSFPARRSISKSLKSRNAGFIKIRAMSSGSEIEDTVKKTIGQNPVVVYSKTWCPYCSDVKSLLRRLGVDPFVVELDQLGSRGSEWQKTLETLTGQRTVPNVFIGGQHIGGCSDIVELHEKGQLQPLLSQAGATKSDP